MCLAIPAKIVEIKDTDRAVTDAGGVRKEVSLRLVAGVKVGDFVLVHAGFAIAIIAEDEARETLDLCKAAGLI